MLRNTKRIIVFIVFSFFFIYYLYPKLSSSKTRNTKKDDNNHTTRNFFSTTDTKNEERGEGRHTIESSAQNKNTITNDDEDLKKLKDAGIERIHDGFKRCVHLKGSFFNTNFMEIAKIPSFIDTKSQEIEQRVRKQHGHIEKVTDAMLRYSCFEAASIMSDNQQQNYLTKQEQDISGKLLYKADLKTYFPLLSFNRNHSLSSPSWFKSSPQDHEIFKFHARIAYLLMVHGSDDDESVSRIMNVIHALIDVPSSQEESGNNLTGNQGDAFVLVHVDLSSENLFKKLKTATKYLKGVFITEKRILVEWGLSSMVFAQLEGFFQLLDVAEWDFVLNLSVHDYPVRNSKYIHTHLKKDHIYIEHWKDDETFSRVKDVIFYMEDMSSWQYVNDRTKFPFPDMTITKHHQWMILPRSYVEYLRTEDHRSHELLMYMERSKIPDEWFFSTIISRKDHPFHKKLINDNKRFVSQFDGRHPIPITQKSIPELAVALDTQDYFLARKVDSLAERKVILWMDKTRNSFN